MFNNRVRLSEKADIVFNALSEQFVILRKDANIPVDFSPENESMLEMLKAKGVLCEDSENEMERAQSIFLNSANDNSYFRLTINPTLQCNFRCWYCYEQHNASSVMSKKTIEQLKTTIEKILNEYNTIELAFFGGEPFLEFDSIVLSLIEYTATQSRNRGKSYIVTFTTNGFLINHEVIKKLCAYNVGVLQITLDGGPIFHNQTRKSGTFNSFEKIVDNIKDLLLVGFKVLLRINLTAENAQSAFEIPKYFEKLDDESKEGLRVLIQQVWQDADNDIFEETWDLYEKFVIIGIKPWSIYFSALKALCYADKRHSAVVNYDGRVFKCTAIDFNKKQEDFTLDKDWFSSLSKAFELRLSKRASNNLCAKCRIFPLCGGGCSKNVDQAMELSEYCLHPTEDDKDRIVKKVIREQLILRKLGLR